MKPNFFIIGAPKCGTTALSKYLRLHPNIYMSDPKEPHYFSEDLPNQRSVKTLDEYLELFKDVNQNHLAVGEASVWYLYSKIALQNIYNFNSQAKIIVMLRNPVEMISSLHAQAVYNCNESEPELEKAWDLQWQRSQGINLPPLCREPKTIQYDQVAKFGEQIAKLLTIFPRQQIHIIWYEDFALETKQVYEDVLTFLGLSSDEKVKFERINANKVHRFKVLGQFTQKPPKNLVEIAMKAKRFLGLERLRILKTIRKINKQEKQRQSLSIQVQSKLIAEYKDDINKLAKILDKDLNHWVTFEK